MPITFLDEEEDIVAATKPPRVKGRITFLDEEEEPIAPVVEPETPSASEPPTRITFLDEEPESPTIGGLAIPPAPEVTKFEATKPKESFLRPVADPFLNIGAGINDVLKGFTDAFGADNAVSQNLAKNSEWYRGLLSAGAKQDQEEIGRIMQEAEGRGVLAEIGAGLKALSVAPIDLVSQGIGSLIPFIATAGVGKAVGLSKAGIAVLQGVQGGAVGGGIVKGEIYNAVKDQLVNSGVDEAKAEKAAQEAQAYNGKNLDQIMLGVGLGVATSTTGADSAIRSLISRKVGKETAEQVSEQAVQEVLRTGFVRGAVKDGTVEFATEALQGGQERLAANIAVGREGFDVEPMRGVVGQATLEGALGGILGGGAGGISARVAQRDAREVVALRDAQKAADEAKQNNAPASAAAVEEQVNQTIEETPDEKVARLEREAQEGVGIDLEEEVPVSGLPPVEPVVPELGVPPLVTPEVVPKTENAVVEAEQKSEQESDTVKVFRGVAEAGALPTGGAFFTDSETDASAYAQLASLRKAVEDNEDLNDIVGEIMAEEGANDITDLSINTIKNIIEGNNIQVGDISEGTVLRGNVRLGNVLNLESFGSEVGSLPETWNQLNELGLVAETWQSLDEEIQAELQDKYRGKAFYSLLEEEVNLNDQFAKGVDTIVFTDQNTEGKGTHRTYLTKAAEQFAQEVAPAAVTPTPVTPTPVTPEVTRRADQGIVDRIVKESPVEESNTFGGNAVTIKLTDPETGGYLTVVDRQDGTPVSVIYFEVPKEQRQKGVGMALQARALKEFPNMRGQVSSKSAARSAYTLGRRPINNPNATLDETLALIDEYSSVNMQAPTAEPPALAPLRRVVKVEQTEEDVSGLVGQGLVELYNGQPVITQAGLETLPEAERPRLTPEARKIQIDTRTSEAAAEAISKNLRIGVDQVPFDVRMPAGWTLEGDIYVPPVVEAAPEFAFAQEVEAKKQNIKTNMIRFASGMSGISDLRAGAYTRAGFKNYGVGFDVGLLSKNAIEELADFIINMDTQAFIDSGAFSNFRKSLKAQEGGKTVEALNFDKIFEKYDAILDAIQRINVAERTDYPRPMIVMPDIIGDQNASLDLIDQYKNRVSLEVSSNTSIPIIPIPLGELSLSEAYNRIIEILKTNTIGSEINPENFVVGIPSNAKAVSKEDLAKFLRESKPPRIHFLGAAADRNISPLIDIVSQNSPETQVTADASKVRSAILSGVAKGKTRKQAIFDALYQEDDPEVVLNAATAPQPEARESRREPAVPQERFYSQLQRTVEAKMPNVSSPEQLKAIIDPTRGSGVKPEEVKWSGITEAIDRIASENNGRVPKEEILKYMRDEGRVRFEEVRMSDAAAQNEMRLKRFRDSQKVMRDAGIFVDVSSTGEVLLRDKYSGPPNVDPENLPPELRREYETLQDNAIEDRAAERLETRYSKYQLEGGTNYREVVMAMPSVETAYEIYRSDNGKLLKTVPESNLEVELNESRKIQKMADNDPAIVKSRKTDKKVQSKNLYTSTTHYPNVPNYVAHMRLNDRRDSDGRDGTFIEEIQSDRHQAGREKGYREDQIGKLPKNWSLKQRGESWIVVDEYGEQIGPLQSTEEAAMQEGISQANFNDINVPSLESGGIPDAPFRKDWPLQMFKRALQEAVASGKEWIGWTTGEMQAARYDLSKQVDALDYQKNQDGTYQLSFQKNQRGNMVGEAIPANKLEEYVGKEVAEKIIEGAGNDVNFAGNNEPQNIFKRLAGLDLKIGGEGMKGFYDNILPKEIAKYVKKWGTTVEKSVVMVDPSNGFYVRYEDGVSQIGNPAVFGVDPDGDKRIVNQNFSNQEAAKADATERNRQLQEGTPIWRVNITPEMRRIIEEEGQPVFSLREAQPTVGMTTDGVRARLEALGFGVEGMIRIVEDPQAAFEGRTIIQDGKAVRIELNASALNDDAAIDRVLNHEFAEAANADGTLNKLVERLTPKEKKEINDAITRLGYEERVRTTEEAARAIETLAAGWKGRGFFERAVARVEAWGSKLGLKLTRRAAEYIAARNLSDINAGFKAAYEQSINVVTETREARIGEQAVVDSDMGLRSQTELTPEEIDRLEKGEKVRVFRAMQIIDGKLYPPMSALVGGKLRKPTEIGTWEKAEERPDLLDKKGKFILQKGNKATVPAAYNPYFHTSSSPLNDQFSSAYKRDNLVTVEVEVPASELTSGYKAEGAKDAVGEVRWNAGPVSSKLPADKKRRVILSRYAKVVRIVPDSEVAGIISNLLEGTNLSIPENTITPSLKSELEKIGVTVTPRPAANVEIRESRRETAPTFTEESPEAKTLSNLKASMEKVDSASEAKGGKPTTQKVSEIAANWMEQGGDERALQDAIIENTNLSPVNAAKVAKVIAKQYDKQQQIAEAVLETEAGATLEGLPEGMEIPKDVDPKNKRTVLQRVIDATTGVRVKPVILQVPEKTALKEQIRLKARETREAKKAQKETADAVVEAIKALELRGPMRAKQAQALAKRAAKVIWTSEKSMENFIAYAERVMANTNYDADLREAKAAQKRAKELSKRDSIAAPQRETLEAIGNIGINLLNDPREFADVVNHYLRSFKPVVSEAYVVVPDKEMKSYLSAAEDVVNDAKAEFEIEDNERLADKYGITIDELKKYMDAEEIMDALTRYAKREVIEGILNEKSTNVKDALKGVDTTILRADQRKLIDAMKVIDVKSLDAAEKQAYIRIGNNIIFNNNQTNGAEFFVATAKGQQAARDLAKNTEAMTKNKAWANILPSLGSRKAKKLLKSWASELQSIADTFRNAFGKEAMTVFYEAMGMVDLDLGFTQAARTLEEIQEKMAKFYDKLGKKYKGAATNQDGILSEGIVGYLIQNVPAKGEADSLAQRRGLMQQGITNLRKSGDEDKIQMADRVQQLIQKLDGDTVDQMLSNLKREYPANYESLMWLKDDLFPQYKDFLKFSDENFNDQANNYNTPNYLPIIYSNASPVLDLLQGKNKYYDNLSSSPKQSSYTIKRSDHTQLPMGSDGRTPKEIGLNLRKNAYNSLSDQITRAYTNPARQRILSFLKTPEAEEALGGKANLDFFADRIERLMGSRERRGSFNEGFFGKAVDVIANLGRDIGTRIALAGSYQLIRQPADQVTVAVGATGRADLMAEHLAPRSVKNARPVLDLFSIGRRGDASSGYKYINQMEGAQSRLERYYTEGNWVKAKEAATRFADKFMAPLKVSDFTVAAATWMTFYRAYLAKNGIRFTTWEDAANLINSDDVGHKRAAAYAENMTDIYQGSSDPTKMAVFAQKGKTGTENILKAILVPFNSFGVQFRARVSSDLTEIFTKSGDWKGKAIAVKDLSATIGGTVMFGLAKRFVLPAITSGGVKILYSIFGVDVEEPDEEKKKEEFDQKWRQLQGDIISTMVVGGFGQMIESYTIDGMNYLKYMIDTANESESVLDDNGEIMSFGKYTKERAPFYRYRSFDNAMSLGILDIGMDQAKKTILNTKMVFTPEEMDKYTPEEQRFLYVALLSDWLYLGGFNDADFARMWDKGRRDMINARKEEEKEIKAIRSGR